MNNDFYVCRLFLFFTRRKKHFNYWKTFNVFSFRTFGTATACSRFTFPLRMKGWVELDSEVTVCSACIRIKHVVYMLCCCIAAYTFDMCKLNITYLFTPHTTMRRYVGRWVGSARCQSNSGPHFPAELFVVRPDCSRVRGRTDRRTDGRTAPGDGLYVARSLSVVSCAKQDVWRCWDGLRAAATRNVLARIEQRAAIYRDSRKLTACSLSARDSLLSVHVDLS